MADRDEKGRFASGNKAGRGRPPKEYANAFARTVSVEEWERVIRRALELALDGHHDARAWLADRLIGKPPQILDLRGGDALLMRELLELAQARGVEITELLEAMIDEMKEDEDGE